MNQKRPDAIHPDLPKTGSKEQKERFNPDGQATESLVTPGHNRYKHICGELVVRDGFLVCTLSKYEHTLEVKDIDEFIRSNEKLMKTLPVQEKVV